MYTVKYFCLALYLNNAILRAFALLCLPCIVMFVLSALINVPRSFTVFRCVCYPFQGAERCFMYSHCVSAIGSAIIVFTC